MKAQIAQILSFACACISFLLAGVIAAFSDDGAKFFVLSGIQRVRHGCGDTSMQILAVACVLLGIVFVVLAFAGLK